MKVYMVSTPSINWPELSRFYHNEGVVVRSDTTEDPAALLVEAAGRLCYMSYGKGRPLKDFIENIINSQHFSVLEHANWGFIITGVSRSLTHELVRHRHFSFSQLSQRYVDESQTEFVCPPAIVPGTAEHEAWLYAVMNCRVAYSDLVKILEESFAGKYRTPGRKAIRQAARSVLPNATETKIFVTGNARTWREFLQKRLSPAADAEIRGLAVTILERLHNTAPLLFADLYEEARQHA